MSDDTTNRGVTLNSPQRGGVRGRRTMASVTLPDETWDQLDRIFLVLGVTKSEVLKRGILLAIEHYEPAVKALEE